MSDQPPRYRLFVEAALEPGAAVPLSAGQAHYLGRVLRQGPGAKVAVFNGRDGEWTARIAALTKGRGELAVEERLRPQARDGDLWLCFAPLKGGRVEMLAEKASELGASVLQPVLTRRTSIPRLNLERLRANALEAAEQCGRLSVPEVREPLALAKLLGDWPAKRRLLLADESGEAPPVADVLAEVLAGVPAESGEGAAWAVLIGPEGGFAPEELAMLRRLPQALPVSLGPRILRAETAAIAALAVLQALAGDWRGGRS